MTTRRAGWIAVWAALSFIPDHAAHATSDDDLITQVRNAVLHNHLASRPQCLSYWVIRNSNPGIDTVDVSALHDRTCGGDPSFGEHLFEVYIDQKTHQMGTDASDPAGGTLKLLPP